MNEHENAPCPCESGKRYIDCCLKLHLAKSRENHARAANEEAQRILRDKNFDSLEALNNFMRVYWDRRNAEPNPDFLGLSSDQIRRLIDFPFQSTDDLVRLNDSFGQNDMAGIPVVDNAVRFLRAMAEVEPLKATAAGNLARDFAKRLFDDIEQSDWKKYINFRSETDSMTVHSLRLILTMGGWLKKEKGWFRLTRKGRKSVEAGFSAADYLDLFRTFTQKFNWGFQDGYPGLEIIQRAFLFSLLLVHKKGGEFLENYRLGPYFVRAFPLALAESERFPCDPYERISRCFSLRFLERFCAYFGLIETKSLGEGPLDRRFFFKASGLLDKLLTWKI
ncbi:MAG: SEC-C domain-containing protein [Acidobacteria bacterium]|nr:SEC-C domain-containing protein [Acidobacteriota bacterium]